MNFKDFFILREGFDSPYPYRPNFEEEQVDTEDDETGEVYYKYILKPVQIVPFKTADGTDFIWYAKQDRYSDVTWEIAFGIPNDKSDIENKNYRLDLELTNKGNAFRIFSTILAITNDFIEHDGDDYEIQNLKFSSEGDKRSEFYRRFHNHNGLS